MTRSDLGLRSFVAALAAAPAIASWWIPSRLPRSVVSVALMSFQGAGILPWMIAIVALPLALGCLAEKPRPAAALTGVAAALLGIPAMAWVAMVFTVGTIFSSGWGIGALALPLILVGPFLTQFPHLYALRRLYPSNLNWTWVVLNAGVFAGVCFLQVLGIGPGTPRSSGWLSFLLVPVALYPLLKARLSDRPGRLASATVVSGAVALFLACALAPLLRMDEGRLAPGMPFRIGFTTYAVDDARDMHGVPGGKPGTWLQVSFVVDGKALGVSEGDWRITLYATEGAPGDGPGTPFKVGGIMVKGAKVSGPASDMDRDWVEEGLIRFVQKADENGYKRGRELPIFR